ncbi:MAG: PDZ domain-containing protein [Candidatus Hydrogenedens sp.]|jgi:serine protease Do|nr:PDZ domain-containing protein [Candidatus Hydrogenedens sp.]
MMTFSSFSKAVWLLSAVLLGVAPLLFAEDAAPDSSEDSSLSIKSAVEQVTAALVRIHVVDAYYAEGREMKSESSGSGVVIDKEGHVVTNHHVAGHAKQLKCVFADKSEYDAELVGTDPLTDIAVIKLKNPENHSFHLARWGDSSTVHVGDPVLAMGSPLALSQSVTRGIISNTEMTLPSWMDRMGGLTLDGENVGGLVRWLAHDAQIFGGNSGGPLVNMAGEIIGINEISLGLSGAIPGNLARSVAQELIASGSVRRAWVGLEVQPRLKSDIRARGVLVSGTIADSPARSAGLEAGDLLLSVGGEAVDIRFPVQLPDFNLLITQLPIGEAVAFEVERDGSHVTLAVTPVERETFEQKQYEEIQWGITIRNISFMMAKELKRKNTDGVLVTSVRPGGPSGDAKPPVNSNDVIVSVGGRPVSNVQQFQEATEAITRDASEPVPTATLVERKNDHLMTVVKVGIREPRDPGLEVKKAWLPVEYQVITRDMATFLGDESLKGFRISQVYKGSSAETAGLKIGDLILAVDDENMTASSSEHHEELAAYIRQYAIDDEVELKIRRNEEILKLTVPLIASPKLAREMKKIEDETFEFTARDITFFDKASEQWSESQVGVLVEQVKPGGWAALGKLSTGDLILEVNGTAVPSVDTARTVLSTLSEEKTPSIVFKVQRGIRTLYLELEPQWTSP